MDTREFIALISRLIEEKNFGRAEELLLEARSKAAEKGDVQTIRLVLSELVELYCIADPPNLTQAETLSLEREALSGDAFSRLQTAMVLYYSIRDYGRAVPKLQEAIDLGRIQNDQSTVYTSLSLLGQALLTLGQTPGALAVLSEIEEMVSTRKPFVVGDETSFLEALRLRQLEIGRVAQLASSLASICRDPAFKKRLEALSVHK